MIWQDREWLELTAAAARLNVSVDDVLTMAEKGLLHSADFGWGLMVEPAIITGWVPDPKPRGKRRR